MKIIKKLLVISAVALVGQVEAMTNLATFVRRLPPSSEALRVAYKKPTPRPFKNEAPMQFEKYKEPSTTARLYGIRQDADQAVSRNAPIQAGVAAGTVATVAAAENAANYMTQLPSGEYSLPVFGEDLDLNQIANLRSRYQDEALAIALAEQQAIDQAAAEAAALIAQRQAMQAAETKNKTLGQRLWQAPSSIKNASSRWWSSWFGGKKAAQ